MAEVWTLAGESVGLGGGPAGPVTLVEGSAFAISSPNGDMAPGSPQGFFFQDSRFLSRLEIKVNGQIPEPLAATTPEPFAAIFVSRRQPRPGHADSTLLTLRHRYIGRGMREDLVGRNVGDESAYCAIEAAYEAD